MADEQKVDDKGVPLENRLKEYERKMAERDRELTELKQWKTSYEAELAKEQEPPQRAKAQERLMEFVADPDNFIERQVEARERKRQEEAYKSELNQVSPWLQQQKGYNPDVDNPRLLAIEREYQLGIPSPLERVRKAWDIRQKELAFEKLNSMNDDQRREDRAHQNALEGSGKSTSKEKTVTRADVVKKLAEAEAKGDLDAAIKYTSLLEDIR